MRRSSSIRCLSEVIGETSVTDESTRARGARGPFEAQHGHITKNKAEDAAHTTAACGLVHYVISAGQNALHEALAWEIAIRLHEGHFRGIHPDSMVMCSWCASLTGQT
jgi:hypothetical protein